MTQLARTDLAFVAALALIVGGVAAIYWPAALIVVGLLGCVALYAIEDAP